MPYRVRKQGAGYIIQHQKAGRWSIKSHHETKPKAEAAARLLRRIEHGMKPRGRR